MTAGSVGASAALLLPLMRRVTLPSPALYPLRVVAAAGVIYGAATLVHGSGFLAVFVAGILIGDRPVPHRREIDEFLASISRRCGSGRSPIRIPATNTARKPEPCTRVAAP